MLSSLPGRPHSSGLLLALLAASCTPPSHPAPADASPARLTLVASPVASAPPAPVPSCMPIPSRVPPRVAGDFSDGSHGRRALDCLEDVSCSVAEVERLFRAADDAREPTEECFRFLDGAGPKRDAVRGRACLERELARWGGCEKGSSAGFTEAQLATLWIDGVGGPACIAEARALFADCYDDFTKKDVLAHADAKEGDAATAPMTFCGEGDGTTLVANTCAANRTAASQALSALQAKELAPLLDAEGKRLLAVASEAHARYASSAGAFATEVYIEGTLRSIVGLERTREIVNEREADLAQFASFAAKDLSDADVLRAQRSVATSYAAVRTSTKGERAALVATQSTWKAYRAAEVAFYEHAFGPTQGAARVRATVSVHLDERRAKECDAPSLSGDQ